VGASGPSVALNLCRCQEEQNLSDGFIIEEGDAPLGHHQSYRDEDGVICSSYRVDIECVEDVYELFLEHSDARATCSYCGKRSRAGHNAEQVARWFVSHACAGTREELS
jgi:hypothetical protein